MGDFLGVILTVAVAGGQRLLRGRGIRVDLGAPRPAGGPRGARQAQCGDGHPGGRESAGDAGRGAARHHRLFDPVGPGGRTCGGAPVGETVPFARHTRHRSAHGVVRHRDHDRRGAACTSGRDGAEEHRDRRPGVGGHAAGAAVSVVGPRCAARHRVLRLVCARDPASIRRRGQDRTRKHGFDHRAVGDDRRVAVGGTARSRGAQPALARPADPQSGGGRRGGAAQ